MSKMSDMDLNMYEWSNRIGELIVEYNISPNDQNKLILLILDISNVLAEGLINAKLNSEVKDYGTEKKQ